jgi:hypothetical protein
VKLAIALFLLLLPAAVLWALGQGLRRRQVSLWKGLVLGGAALVLLLGNPLVNAALLAPLDASLQRKLFARAHAAHLIGADEARLRQALGKPWKVRTFDGPFSAWAYAPCKVCLSSYGAPFLVYLEAGKVQGFRSATGEVER